MYLIHYQQVLREYDISLGFTAAGHKQFEGDGKTPEGAYYISHRNPRSAFHLSLGISYPNEADRAYASSKGRSPGGDIFIHGHTGYKGNRGDWTAGCIAVRNREMEEIYSMVQPRTPIVIYP
jgi:murein L,D-transpeptidase YafK